MTSSANRQKLVRAARTLFAARGYAHVSVDEIAAAAGLTKGAVYYQFADKTELFSAACEDVLHDIAADVTKATMGEIAHVADEIVTGADHLFDAYERPEARQLLLIDAPAVLGPLAATALQQKLGLVEHALGHLVDEGLLAKAMAPAMAQLLTGAFMQGVLQIANAVDEKAEGRRVRAAFKRLAQGLLTTAPLTKRRK